MRSVAGRGMVVEFRRASLLKRAPGRFYMSGMGFKVSQAFDFLVDPLQGRHKDLLSL